MLERRCGAFCSWAQSSTPNGVDADYARIEADEASTKYIFPRSGRLYG